MPDSSDAAFCTGEEQALIEHAADSLWETMAKLVDTGPTYAGTTGPERAACIGRLALQAFAHTASERIGADGRVQSYVLLSAMGRLLGQFMVGWSPEVQISAMILFEREVRLGKQDVEHLLEPQGNA